MAKRDYTELAQSIIENVGGTENINSVAHCITRLRFKLKDADKANTEAVEKLPGVIKVMNANGQYQVSSATRSRTSTTPSSRSAASPGLARCRWMTMGTPVRRRRLAPS